MEKVFSKKCLTIVIAAVCLLFFGLTSIQIAQAKENPGLLKLQQSIQLFENQQLDEAGTLLCIVTCLYDLVSAMEECEGDSVCNTEVMAIFVVDIIACIPEEEEE